MSDKQNVTTNPPRIKLSRRQHQILRDCSLSKSGVIAVGSPAFNTVRSLQRRGLVKYKQYRYEWGRQWDVFITADGNAALESGHDS
jgi:hypothetical protein